MRSTLTFSRYSVSKAGTEAAEWDRKTWPELQQLAENVAEAGIHFQGTVQPIDDPSSIARAQVT